MAGTLIKLQEINASTDASIDVGGNTYWDNSFNVYVVNLIAVKTSTDNKSMRMRVLESGTVNTTSNYDGANRNFDSNGAAVNGYYENQDLFYFTESLGTGTGEAMNTTLFIYNANDSDSFTHISWENSNFMQSAYLRGRTGGGIFTSVSAVNGLQFFMQDSVDIASGTFTLYGLNK